MIKKQTWLAILLGLALVVLAPLTASADGMKFTVHPVIPKNALQKNVNYFDLKMAPGAAETLKFEVTNHASESVDIDISGGTATTSNGGAVDYISTDGKSMDRTMQFPLGKNLTVGQNRLHLEAKEVKNVTVQVQMPAAKVNGVLAGGVRFHQVNKKDNSKSKGFKITNQLAYVVAVVVRQKSALPNPNLNLLNVKATLQDSKNVIGITLQNNQPTFLNTLEVAAKVLDDTGKTKYSYSQSMMQMAPNSNFQFPVRLEGKKFVAGEYSTDVTAYYVQNPRGQYIDASGKRFLFMKHWTQKFTITEKAATDLNRMDGFTNKSTIPLWGWIMLYLAAFVLVLIGFLAWMFHRQNKNLMRAMIDD